MSENDDLDSLAAFVRRVRAAPDSPGAESEGAAKAARREMKETRVVSIEGQGVDVGELQDNPFARRLSWRSAFRGSGARAVGATALASAVLALGLHLRPTAAPHEVLSKGGVVRLQTADPHALKKQIVEDFQAAGVHTTEYERPGISGIDAGLSQPLSQEVRGVLQKYRIPAPRDSVLRVEIAASSGR